MTEESMSVIVRTMACILTVPMLMFGLYVMLHGHLTPGGGFPGGAVMATVVALMLAAFGGAGKKLKGRKDMLSAVESIGLLAFIAIAFLGIGTTFFYNFLANTGDLLGMTILYGPNPGYLASGGVVMPMNMAVGIEVFAALSAIMILMYTHEGGKADD